MSRFRSSGSYGFHLRKLGEDHYRMSWTYDRYYAGDRLRYPQLRSRDTDLTGAKRFAKRHKLTLPE